MSSDEGDRRGPGRPRSADVRRRILDATSDLLASGGLASLTMAAIAATAGVSKATLYRWWPSQESVVAEAVLAQVAPAVTFVDTGSMREDLRRQVTGVAVLFSSPRGHGMRDVIACAQWDAALARAFRERFMAVRQADARDALGRGVERGQLRADLDLDVAVDMIYGPLYYRFLVSGAPLGPDYACRLLDQLWPSLAPAPG